MKKGALIVIFLAIAFAPAWADGQFRLAGNTSTPVDALPSGDLEDWHGVLVPTDMTMTGWSWEVIFDRLGFGMHYGIRFGDPVSEDESAGWYLDWKGDLFLSYHLLGGGSVVDPFLEFGWGNVGTVVVSDYDSHDYPDWEGEVEYGSAVALGFYNYFAAGVALDLNGLLLGAKISYIPSGVTGPDLDPSVDIYPMSPFEVGLFGGVALGGHRNRSSRSRWD